MASNPFFKVCFETPKTQTQKDQELQSYEQNKAQISTFPVEFRWGHPQRNYQSFWLPESILPGVLSLQQNFKPNNDDILLVTYPKSGTTWLKALTFTIVNRFKTTFANQPLLSRHPYDCAPYLESLFSTPYVPDINVLSSPRPLATHIPYSILPASIKNSRIVYLSRDPKDALVSMWHFLAGASPVGTKPVALETMFDLLCDGVSPYGPVWDHQLEYWKVSLEQPENVLFLRYEELKKKPEENVRRLAKFVGMAFSEEEEKGGVVEEVVRLCGFKNLKELEVNKNGVRLDFHVPIKNSLYFRKGIVGDWKEYLSEEMGERIDGILEEKLEGSGLNFKI